MKPESRDALLTAIAKAWEWIDDIRLGHFASFAEIAEREALGERHIRLLAPLAFLSPRILAAIADGTAAADLTVTGLAKGAEDRAPFAVAAIVPVPLIHGVQWLDAVLPTASRDPASSQPK